MFTPLHPPANLCYVPIAQHNVGQSARVQMLYVLLLYLSKINTFHMTFCGWPAAA